MMNAPHSKIAYATVTGLAVLAFIGAPSLVEAQTSTHDGEMSDEKVEAIERLLTEKMSEGRIPGLSVAVVHGGQLVWAAGYGFADLENFVPATATTVYRTASIGKALTATAVMQLVESGAIDLDVPIQRYCAAFPEKRWPITTRHLLGHTSGIRHYGGPNEEAELFNTVHYDDVEGPLEIFAADPLLFEPGRPICTARSATTFSAAFWRARPDCVSCGTWRNECSPRPG